MKTNYFKLGLASAVLIGSVSHSAIGWAQENTGIDEIVVTAQFREQNLQDTPLAITAISAKTLEARGQYSIEQVALQAPSVQLAPMGGAFGASIGTQIRGVGQFDFNPAYEPGVGMYVDDVYLATLVGANLELLDLERVEILRGPQGTLTGRNSIGGAIRMISKKPKGDGSGYLYAGYGTSNRTDLRGAIDFSLGENLATRISGTYRDIDGFIDRVDYGCANPGNAEGIPARATLDDCVVQKLGAQNYGGLRAQTLWTPSDALNVTLIADYVKQDNSQSADVVFSSGNPNFLCGDDCIYSNYGNFTDGIADSVFDPNQTFKGFGLSGKIEYDISDTMNLTYIGAYRQYNTTFGTDDDAGPTVNVGAFNAVTNPNGGTSGGSNNIDHDFFSSEIRLNGQLTDNVTYTVGGFYSDQKTVYETLQDIRYIFPGAFAFYGNDPVVADSIAAFTTVIWDVSEALTLTGGLRYTEESKDYTFVRRDTTNRDQSNIFLGALDNLTASYAGEEVDYRISGDYRFNDSLLAYATLSTGFKGGGVTARPFNADHVTHGTFEPEKATNYEVGIKTDLLDDQVRLNISAYVNKYTDIQLPLSNCSNVGPLPAGQNAVGPCAVVANAGDGTYKGIEAEIQYNPGTGLSIDGSMSYLDAKFDSVTAAAGGGSLDLDDPAAFAPDWKFSFGIQYENELQNGSTITPRLDVSYVGDRFTGRDTVTAEQTFLENYTIVNARIAWVNEEGDLTIAAEASNLLDEDYSTALFDAVKGFAGTAYKTHGRGQEFLLSVRKNF